MNYKYTDFLPKSISCFREGYTRKNLCSDLFAGISVGVIALPLALAFAIASGVSPERGIFTAIVAGFLISFLGGSRVQIGGPTGAFVVIVYAVVQQYSYEGLALATLLAAVMMIVMGIARFGVVLKFIPYSVTTGFTTGIAVVIAFSQMKDFFGFQVEKVPPEFLQKCSLYCKIAHTSNGFAVLIGVSTLLLLFLLRRYCPKWPAAILALTAATAVAYGFDFPIESIESTFGGIPRVLPSPSFPVFSYALLKEVFPSAITIAFLGAVESLLSASVADGVIGSRHRSNMELVAQGFANIGSVLFGGIPATGAIARTSANIKMGGKTPVAGMVHALTLFFLMFFLAPIAGKIPLAALAAILLFVAWNMSELSHFIELLKGQKGDAMIVLLTFGLTVFIDLTVAVQVGVVLAAFVFIKRMTNKTTIAVCRQLVRVNEDEGSEPDEGELLFRKDIPEDVMIFEIRGPFFYCVADLLDEALVRLDVAPRVFILRLHKTSLIDSTGLRALKQFGVKCQKKGITFMMTEVTDVYRRKFIHAGITKVLGTECLFPSVDLALQKIC